MNLLTYPGNLLLPSTDRLLQQLEEDLARRRSVVVLLPDSVKPAFVFDQLRERLWRRGFDVRDLYVADQNAQAQQDLVSIVADLLHVTWPDNHAAHTVERLHRSLHDIPDVMFWVGLESVAQDVVASWLAFQRDWAGVSHTRAGEQAVTTAMCAILPARTVENCVPSNEVMLAVYWWWGVPSQLEVHLHCRMLAGGSERDALMLWREHVLPELAGSDEDLINALWNDVALPPVELCSLLCRIGNEKGWSKENLLQWGGTSAALLSLQQSSSSFLEPLPTWRRLWTNGVLYSTDDHGVELHAVALAVLGCKHEFDHRLWRAQSTLLQPLINRLRLLLCDRFTDRYGPDWPLRWRYPDSDKEAADLRASPAACEWGHMKQLMEQEEALRSEKQFKRLVRLAHNLRNELSHYHPVAFAQFEDLWLEIQRLPI